MEIVSDIAANHRDMTKFGSLNDPGFTSIMTTLLRWRSLSNSDTEKCRLREIGRSYKISEVADFWV
jgi:hypothetical protein